ncbi:MAG: DUF4339 domain-containing protein [Gemmataceae bacterium]|nr:DUF4339 domain-containing protein [Gemmataceae bacterium]
MPAFSCPHCQNPFSLPSESASAQVLCPHCRKPVSVPTTQASRWYLARDKKKHGPYSWKQFMELATRGDLCPDDLVLREGEKQWRRADSVPNLFPAINTTPKIAESTPKKEPAKAKRATPWLLIGITGATFLLLIVVGSISLHYFIGSQRTIAGPTANRDQKPVEKSTPTGDPKLKTSDQKPKAVDKIPDKDRTGDTKTIKIPDKKPVIPTTNIEIGERFVALLNRHRQTAGQGSVTLDANLSRGCQAHAKYVARNVDPNKADANAVQSQDETNPEATPEGKATASNAMVAFLEPTAALDRWMARLFSRATLLNSEMQSIGVGFERRLDGWWVCVVDPLRGRGDPLVIYPTPKQLDVPLSFSGGLEVPDGQQAAGFPITVTFSPTKKITQAKLTLSDANGKSLDGWLSTPEKPVRENAQRNSIALIPKTILQRATAYHAKASADIDGKPWSLAWSFTTEDDSDSRGVWAKQALDKVNAYRKNAGLSPVVLDDNLSKGCLAHARYLVINGDHKAVLGLGAHDEDLSLPGASKEGQIAGKASDIAIGDYEPTDGVDAWMATLYHRVPILEPNLRTIGFGCARGRRQGWVTVLNVVTGRDRAVRPNAVYYPAPDQTGVPLNFPNGGEEPNPIPDDKDGKAGYPITAFFPETSPLKNASATLSNAKGESVACWFSNAEKPANPKFPKHQGNTICLVPHDPLSARTMYHVDMKGQLDGKPWQKKWAFTTDDSGLSVAAAKKQVLDRLNRYRTEAGLPAVEANETLGRGCQLHAEYLVKNTDQILKMNGSVNDENPLLDGFTAEGAHAARQSDVFSNAPTPLTQIDDLMATFMRRVYILDPELQSIGFGCAHDIGRGWRCVLDLHGGRGNSRVIVYPARDQENVPTVGYDHIDGVKGNPGFPISVIFPRLAKLNNAQAVLVDADKNNVDVRVTSPEQPLNEKLQRSIVGIHPLAMLRPNHIYTVTLSVLVDGAEWRQMWQFKTAGK